MPNFLTSSSPWISVLSAGLALSVTAAAAEMTEIPVQKGDDLTSALRRVHPCFDAPGVKIPAQIITDNPERVGRGGTMVLARPTLRVPKDFLDPKIQCSPPVTESPQVESPKLAVPAISERETEVTPNEPKTEHEGKHEEEKQGSAAHEEEEEHASPYKNHLTVFGLVDYSTLAATVNATGAMPIFVSKPQPGLELVYARDLSSDWSVGFKYMYLSTAFQEQEGLDFTELSSALQEYEVSLRYRITHTSRISLMAGAAQVDELSVNSDGTLVIDHSFRMTGGFLFTQELGRLAGLEVVGGLGAQLFVPTDWSRDAVGVGELFRLLFERQIAPRWMVEFGLLGSYERQETQDEAHSELSIALGLGLNFRF